MSDAEKLLDSLAEVVHEHDVVDADVRFTIDPFSRTISSSNGQKTILIQGDHKSERFTFEIPRYIEGHDMLLCDTVRIPYINSEVDGRNPKYNIDVHTVGDLQVDPENDKQLIFSWTVSDSGTMYEGVLTFSVVFLCLNGKRVTYRFGTDIYENMFVRKTPEIESTFELRHLDIIEQWKDEVRQVFTEYIDSEVDKHIDVAREALSEELTNDIDEAASLLNERVTNFTQEVDVALAAFNDILETEITTMGNNIDVLESRMDTFTALKEGSTTGDAELADIRVGADGKIYPTAGEAVREQFKTVRGQGFMVEGELIIDTTNHTISAKSLMLLTSDRSFGYITNVDAPVTMDNTDPSLRSIFAVKTDDGFRIHIGVESDMNKYTQVYYICGYYSKKLVGSNFGHNLLLTIDGKTKSAWESSYNGNYDTIVSMLSEKDSNLIKSYQKLIDFIYNISSANENTIEFASRYLTASNYSMNGNGELGDGVNEKRLSVHEMIPSYNSNTVKIIMSEDVNYVCNLYLFDENKNYISSSYHTGKNGTITASINAAYFRVMIARSASTATIDTSELVGIQLYSIKRKTTVNTVLSMLMSDETTHIKLLGDSITQGMGSTGYVGYTITENGTSISVRGNGPDYPSADGNYKVGDYLGADGNRRWYESVSSTGWGNKLKSYFESKFNCEVKNYGMSGIASSNLSDLCKPLVSDEDDVVFLMIGTNDRTSTTKDEFKTNVTEFVQYLLDNDKKVVLIGSTPVSVDNEKNADYHMEDVNYMLRNVANSCDVLFISLYDYFIEYSDIRGVSVDTFLKDGLHPNDAGYDLMFRVISTQLGVSIPRSGATWG